MALKPKRYHRLWPALLLSVALSTTLHAESVPTAQPDPALARGFAPEQLFQGYAELDNVNAFNGNLVIPIPLGQEYSVGGDLAIEALDHQGRLRRVTENSGAGGAAVDTFYDYDISGLKEVRIVGPTTQIRRIDRDGRGLVLSRQDPEIGPSGNGTITYSSFDALGNPRSQRISGGTQFNFDFTFDKANRLVRVDSNGRPLKEYFYARFNRGLDKAAGKLVLAKRHNYLVDPATGEEIDVIVSERTKYAGRGGRVSHRVTSANRSFLQERACSFRDRRTPLWLLRRGLGWERASRAEWVVSSSDCSLQRARKLLQICPRN